MEENTSKDNLRDILLDIYSSLEKGNYDPISQIVGYLNSGDPGYVSSYDKAREKIIALDREVVIEILLKEYLHK